ncbi:MAG: hypothetical protein J3K34DRAFT_519833 [Monoraphidium minutum]|nr:MAG: hypothetical protein J3K34DRAFT_519833 [Monoraphidium minutum]
MHERPKPPCHSHRTSLRSVSPHRARGPSARRLAPVARHAPLQALPAAAGLLQAARPRRARSESKRRRSVPMAAEPEPQEGPVQGGAAHEDDVSFLNADGLRLAGTFVRSGGAGGGSGGAGAGAGAGAGTGGTERPKCVILCHGYASYRDDMALPQLAQGLAAAGLNSLRFDFTGNGGSEGTMRFANFQGEVSDVAAAKRFLETQLQQQVVGLLGHSKGGDVVILYAAQHGDIPRVVNVAGRFVMTEGLAERFGADIFDRLKAGPVEVSALLGGQRRVRFQLTDEDVQERMAVDIPAACAAIAAAGPRVLTVHGTRDRAIDAKDARLFAGALPGSGLVLVQGADHNFTAPDHKAELVAAAVHFLYFGNLHPCVTVSALQDICSYFGAVDQVKVIKDKTSGVSAGYGFVKYADRRCALVALQYLNSKSLFGQEMRVNWAFQSHQREDTSGHWHLFVGDLGQDVTDAVLFAAFSQLPGGCSDARVMWDHATGRSKGYGFVAIRSREEAQAAIDAMHGQVVGSRRVRCGWAQHKQDESSSLTAPEEVDKADPANTNVYLGNIAPDWSEAEVTAHFAGFGPVAEIKLHKKGGYGFVRYREHADAVRAIAATNTQSFYGRAVKACWGKNATGQPRHSGASGSRQRGGGGAAARAAAAAAAAAAGGGFAGAGALAGPPGVAGGMVGFAPAAAGGGPGGGVFRLMAPGGGGGAGGGLLMQQGMLMRQHPGLLAAGGGGMVGGGGAHAAAQMGLPGMLPQAVAGGGGGGLGLEGPGEMLLGGGGYMAVPQQMLGGGGGAAAMAPHGGHAMLNQQGQFMYLGAAPPPAGGAPPPGAAAGGAPLVVGGAGGGVPQQGYLQAPEEPLYYTLGPGGQQVFFYGGPQQ